MSAAMHPRDARDVEDAVSAALARDVGLEIVGHGTKRGIGRPAQTQAKLDLSGLSGVTLYEPEELVLSARAGTPLAEIDSLLASHRQELAFEPMDYGPLFGEEAGRATIGGVLAANLAGPRRLKAGAARDHLLGVSAVSGRGETFKSGGRVVKNVTGYDLCKVLAGSWGTLAVMTDVTLKVLPRAETQATVVVQGLDIEAAVRAMSAAMGSSCDVSSAAHVPAPHPETLLRIEGVAPSVRHRQQALTDLMRPFGAVDVLDERESRTRWRAIGDAALFAGREEPLWRISVPPMSAPQVARALARASLLFDWAGGLIWAECPLGAADGDVQRVRAAVDAVGGHATLIRAPAAVRAAIDVFQPEEARLAAVTARVKNGFDPGRILNAGRMWAGV